MATNTQTSMVNGLAPLHILNRNRWTYLQIRTDLGTIIPQWLLSLIKAIYPQIIDYSISVLKLACHFEFVRFPGKALSCAQNAPEAIMEAKKRLQTTFTFVGATEDLVASLWLAARVFGWSDTMVLDGLVHPRPGLWFILESCFGSIRYARKSDRVAEVNDIAWERERGERAECKGMASR